MAFHYSLTGLDIHTLVSHTFADASARTSFAYTTADTGKLVQQSNDSSLWFITSISGSIATFLGVGAGGDISTLSTALETAWFGTAAAKEAMAVATDALSTTWTGTSSAAAAMAVATDALSTAWSGTSTGAAAKAVATEALTTAWSGTGIGAQANAVATDALSTAWTGTDAAATALSSATTALATANSAFNLVSGQAPYFTTDGWALDFFEEYATGSISVFDKGLGWSSSGTGFGCTIISSPIANGKTEKRLRIQNGQFGRKFYFGAQWNRLAIVVLARFDGSNTFTADGYTGVCSGQTSMTTSTSTDNFAGIEWSGGGTPNNWAYNVGVLTNYFRQSTGTRFATRRGTTTTDRGSGAGSDGRAFVATGTFRSGYLLEVSRGPAAKTSSSVTYSFGMRSTDTTNVDFALSKHAVLDILNEAPSSTLGAIGAQPLNGGGGGGGGVTVAYAFDESTGTLDTFNLSWVADVTAMEICAIGIKKVY